MVLPGMKLDGASLFELIRDEGVTFCGAVPTVWLTLFAWMEQHLDTTDQRGLKLKRVLSGGSAVPRVVIEKAHAYFDATMLHAWGMTEMSPLGTCGSLLARHVDLDLEQRISVHLKQGRTIYGADVRIVDDEGHELPRDGRSVGEIQVRGPWVLSSYFKGAGGKVVDDDGWFRTGDVAHMDADGFLTITDRAKDVIKSGGEWISSIEIENLAVGHPGVLEAAVVATRHPRWQERPLLLVHRKQGVDVTKEELLSFLSDKIAKWWLPDDVVFVDELPHTATGKVLKTRLREQYGDWLERARLSSRVLIRRSESASAGMLGTSRSGWCGVAPNGRRRRSMNAVRMPAAFAPIQSNAWLAMNSTSSMRTPTISAAFVYVATCGLNELAAATEISALERDAVVLPGILQHIGIAVRQHHQADNAYAVCPTPPAPREKVAAARCGQPGRALRPSCSGYRRDPSHRRPSVRRSRGRACVPCAAARRSSSSRNASAATR